MLLQRQGKKFIKEGKLTFYTTSSVEVGRKMLDQFREKYPFIQTDIYRTGSQGMLTKVLAETTPHEEGAEDPHP